MVRLLTSSSAVFFFVIARPLRRARFDSLEHEYAKSC
jgi:hypothetical protein